MPICDREWCPGEESNSSLKSLIGMDNPRPWKPEPPDEAPGAATFQLPNSAESVLSRPEILDAGLQTMPKCISARSIAAR